MSAPDRETELLERWRAEREIFDAWGRFVAKTISAAVSPLISPMSAKAFFRLPISSRMKDERSLLEKAFYRGKPYRDPYNEIEDKVGVRVVVLFLEDIRLVEGAIKEVDVWSSTMARDFDEERRERPFEFDYQSLHYVVRSAREIECCGKAIPPSIPCEIQIRTILQHAYSELTHDTIYKPSIAAEPDVKRAAAKSMALIEATDDYFTQVKAKIAAASAPADQISRGLRELYRSSIGEAVDDSPLNILIIDHYKKWANGEYISEIHAFLDDKPFIAERVRERSLGNHLYRLPSILLVYWATSIARSTAHQGSPLSRSELEPIYSDLGLRLPEVLA